MPIMSEAGSILARPSGGVLATDCGGGCTGDDPLCQWCGCEAELAASYLVSLSGFPNAEGLATFNGAWTVSWESDCLWSYDITPFHRLTLSVIAGGGWLVAFAVDGGADGTFAPVDAAPGTCAPTTWAWALSACVSFFPSTCAALTANGVAVVS